LPKPLAVGLAVGGCALVYVFRASSIDAPPLTLWASFSAALLVAGATFGDFSLEGPVWRSLAIIGDASYSIYLLHSAPIRGALFLSRATSLDFASAPWLYVGLALAGAIALGIVSYYMLERPLTRYFRSLLKPRKFAPASAA
jgi:exopolysaccharide production protein ExoZ